MIVGCTPSLISPRPANVCVVSLLIWSLPSSPASVPSPAHSCVLSRYGRSRTAFYAGKGRQVELVLLLFQGWICWHLNFPCQWNSMHPSPAPHHKILYSPLQIHWHSLWFCTICHYWEYHGLNSAFLSPNRKIMIFPHSLKREHCRSSYGQASHYLLFTGSILGDHRAEKVEGFHPLHLLTM